MLSLEKVIGVDAAQITNNNAENIPFWSGCAHALTFQSKRCCWIMHSQQSWELDGPKMILNLVQSSH